MKLSQRLLSEMSPDELAAELIRCQEQGEKALAQGMINQYQVYEQRYYLARSYQMNPHDIALGATYGLANNTGLFIARRLNGVFVYGTLLGETEERGFPIGQLVALDFDPKAKQ